MAGGAALLLAALLLVPGIDGLSAALYGDGGRAPAAVLILLGTGTTALVVGTALLVLGRRRHAADLNRARGYAEQHDGHTIPAEDRPTNPYDTSLRGHQTGISG